MALLACTNSAYGKNHDVDNAILYGRMTEKEQNQLPDWTQHKLKTIYENELNQAESTAVGLYRSGASAEVFTDTIAKNILDSISFGLLNQFAQSLNPGSEAVERMAELNNEAPAGFQPGIVRDKLFTT